MARREVWFSSPGYPYTISYEGSYKIHIDEAEDKEDAEDKAWDIMETLMPDANDEFQKAYVEEAKEVKEAPGGGYDVTMVAEFEVYVVCQDIDEASDEALGLVDGIDLPSCVAQLNIEEKELEQVGERILILHGDDV